MKERISRDMIGFLKYLEKEKDNRGYIIEYLQQIGIAKLKHYGSNVILDVPATKLRSMQYTVKTLKDRNYIETVDLFRSHIKYSDIITHMGTIYRLTQQGRELIAKHSSNYTNNKEVST